MRYEFLDEADKAIVKQALLDAGCEPDKYFRFWSFDQLQLDDDYSLPELRAFVLAMERLAARHQCATDSTAAP